MRDYSEDDGRENIGRVFAYILETDYHSNCHWFQGPLDSDWCICLNIYLRPVAAAHGYLVG
jgi:hypothetical protein